MSVRNIHITGASGSGTTTLGRALAARTGAVHLDTDDFYWLPEGPAFTNRRSKPEMLRLMSEAFEAARPRGWILSGSVGEWGERLIPLFDLVVFLTAPTALRLERLRERETKQFGADAVGPGGERHDNFESFIAWAAGYDSGEREGRSLPRHETWLAKLPCPVLHLNGAEAVDVLATKVLAGI